jgi:flagellin
MALSINTNVASLNAQRNLEKSQETLSTSLQRLSTGLRINSAKDDAAGLAITTRFTTQINGLNQAVRNANDGISLAQTGEAAIDEITNNLQRIRELAVQSANSTYSASDREAMDSEVQQRLAEIDRIGSQTSFNGTKLLDGSFGHASFQVGANVGETIGVNLATGVKSNQIGQTSTSETNVGVGALAADTVNIAVGDNDAVTIDESVEGKAKGQTADSAFAKAEAINSAGVFGLSATATNSVDTGFAAITSGTGGGTYSLTINDVKIFDGAATNSTGTSPTADEVVNQVNQNSVESGVIAKINDTDDGIVFTAADGREIDIVEAQTSNGDASTGGLAGGSATHYGQLTLSSSETIRVVGGLNSGNGNIGMALADESVGLGSETLSSVTVSSVDNSNDAIQRIDSALSSVSTLRSEFGAVQNRFESTITNLQTISENLSASRGRILDADFAAETANLTKAQILQQAGTAILAQANALPQAALSLLQ